MQQPERILPQVVGDEPTEVRKAVDHLRVKKAEKNIMRTFKIICIAVLLALAAVFTYQNTAVMQINFLFWSVSMSACLMLLITLFLGIIIGLLLSLLNVRRKARKKSIQIQSVQ